MQTVDNPKELFRKVDASSLGEDEEYEFNIGEDSGGQLAVRQETVQFEDLSDPADDFHAALEAIEDNATVIEDADEHDADVDTKFATEEDGEPVVYMADTDRMGYEVIKSFSDPRLAAYTVLFPDSLVKIEP